MYREPVLRFLERRGTHPEKAQDLAQGFIEHLLEKNRFEGFARGPHKFRSFLLECLKRYCRDEWRKETAAKRGGGVEPIDIDDAQIGHTLEIERLLDLDFAKAVHAQALAQLRAEKRQDAKKLERFEGLRLFIWGSDGGGSYETAGKALQMTGNHVKKAVFDLRHSYFETFRRVAAQSVMPDLIEEETRYLLTLLAESGAASQL